ncbi:YaaA family protein [Nocardia cyriacigeorgica]|uniref:YaaA family protein n=1 Tax=Nocardia cyriacigeorgica TaxID=135487 RepID=UPI002454D241|nr:peroxide stress protein YaaA [Nocardia cyriacigeorgica]
MRAISASAPLPSPSAVRAGGRGPAPPPPWWGSPPPPPGGVAGVPHSGGGRPRPPPPPRTALGLGKGADAEIARNAALRTSPTRPALERYTGVLYDALDARSFTKVQRAKAYARLGIGSALFGAVRAGDPIPAYRLSGGSKLPGLPTLSAVWRDQLPDALRAEAGEELVIDLRSGTYQQLGRVPGAITANVLTEHPDGSRTVVSHFNKHHKGLLARALVLTRAEPADIRAVARIATKAGLRTEIASPTELLIIT